MDARFGSTPFFVLLGLALLLRLQFYVLGGELGAREVLERANQKLNTIRTCECVVELRYAGMEPGIAHRILWEKDTGRVKVEGQFGKVPWVTYYDGENLWMTVGGICWYGPVPRDLDRLRSYRSFAGAEMLPAAEVAKVVREEVVDGRRQYVLEGALDFPSSPKVGKGSEGLPGLAQGLDSTIWIDEQSGVITGAEQRTRAGQVIVSWVVKEFRANPPVNASMFRPPPEIAEHGTRLTTKEVSDPGDRISRAMGEFYKRKKQKAQESGTDGR